MRPRILLVEDNANVAMILAEVLGERGFDVEIAQDGIAALERLDHADFDIVVSDVRMPRLDGHGLFLELARRSPSYADRLIFITGCTEHELAPLRAASIPVMRKPFEITDLDDLIRLKLPKSA